MSKEENAFQSEREGKRSQFTQEAEGSARRGATLKILALAAFALVGLAVYLVAGSGSRGEGAASGGGPLKAEGGAVNIPVSELSDKARFYEYKTAAGKSVRFFAMRSSDGAYRAALDACDVCYASKKGYRQEGEDMVCNNCGMHFPSAKVNEAKGGCNPAGLERKVDGDRIRIDARGLEAGASYF